MDHTDALEDWVAIKDHPFLDTNKPNHLEFLIAWNEVDWKIAITCRERSRVASDTEVKGWSKLFSLSELQSIHEQLALVHPSLGPLMPQLPEEPRGIWSYITPPDPPSDDLCQQLTTYLRCALDICGNTLLTSTLCEEHDCEEYFENISELRRRTYDEAVARADDELQNVLFLRSGAINMLDMAEVYLLEDQALFKLNIALAQLYNYLIQPFLDMREMAFDKLREARNGLKNPDLGKRRKDELAARFTEWNENYTHALDRIQELYMEYYEKTVSILSEVKERMLEDKKRFGQKTFEVAALERYNRVCEDLALENLQLLNNTKRHYDNQREKVKQKIASLDPETVAKQLGPFEQEVYNWQRKVYDVQLEISQLEEQLIRMRIHIFQQEQAGDEYEFFDAVETEEDLENLTDCQDPEINKRINALKQKLGAILKKRAQIRNRYKKLENDKMAKELHKIDKKEKFKQHHSVQLKRENQATDREVKQEFIKEERKKTLQRLKEYKMKKHPVPLTIKPRKISRTKVTSKTSKTSQSKDDTDSKAISPSGTPPSPLPQEGSNHITTSESNTQPLSGVSCATAPPLPPPPPPPVPPPPPPLCPPPLISLRTTGTSSISNTVQTNIVKGKDQVVGKDPDKSSASKGSLPGISLDHIQDAREKLKKVPANNRSKVKSSVDPMADVLQLIKHGVKLRPVDRGDVKDRSEVGSPKHIVPSSDSHTRQLMDAIERISSRLRTESDDEDTSDIFDDFD